MLNKRSDEGIRSDFLCFRMSCFRRPFSIDIWAERPENKNKFFFFLLLVISLCTFSTFEDGEARYSYSGPSPQAGTLIRELWETAHSEA